MGKDAIFIGEMCGGGGMLAAEKTAMGWGALSSKVGEALDVAKKMPGSNYFRKWNPFDDAKTFNQEIVLPFEENALKADVLESKISELDSSFIPDEQILSGHDTVVQAYPQKLTKGRVIRFLSEEVIMSFERPELIKIFEFMGFKLEYGSSDAYNIHDGRFCEFYRKGVKRIQIHEHHKYPGSYPHIHIFDEKGKYLDRNLNIVDRKSPDAHIEIRPMPRSMNLKMEPK